MIDKEFYNFVFKKHKEELKNQTKYIRRMMIGFLMKPTFLKMVLEVPVLLEKKRLEDELTANKQKEKVWKI